MAVPRPGIVVDIGNTRLKFGHVSSSGRLMKAEAAPIDRPEAWAEIWGSWAHEIGDSPALAVSSVNPPAAARLGSFLEERGIGEGCSRPAWYRSAADVPVDHRLEQAETAGADRALAVAAMLELLPEGRPGLIVSCGTAITIERITRERVWQGGAIASGLGLSAKALNQNTAQLPLVEPGALPSAWGNSTRPALEAGIFWGVAGGVRELLMRQADDLPGDPWVVWTGGDAELIAGVVTGPDARIEPHLVLKGLIRVSLWSD